MALSKQLALRVPKIDLDNIDASLQSQGLVEWTIKSKEGGRSLTGRTAKGVSVRISLYEGGGFREKSASICFKMNADKRKVEAKKLRRRGLTQSEIAERLGCSQKTISNDLK